MRGALDLDLQLGHLLGESLHFLNSREEVRSLHGELLAHIDHSTLQYLVRVHVVGHAIAELLAVAALLEEHLRASVERGQLCEGSRPYLLLLLLHIFLLLREELQILL